MKKYFISIFIGLLCISAKAGQNYDSLAYIYVMKYKDIAVEEMNRVNIPASITLAQGLLETGFGTSVLTLNTNNHFGIKCHENWTGKTYSYTDDAPDECFRVYDNPAQSFRDHSDFLRSRPRYAKLFGYDPKDYKSWAYGLKDAGYATNPKYPELLIKYIETYHLDKYDQADYIEDEWMSDRPVNVTDEVVFETNPAKHNTKEENDNVKIDGTINYPKQSSVVKSGPKKIYKVNKRKAVKMGANEDLEVIATKMNISEEDLMAYNDLVPGQTIPANQYVFIQSKRKKGADEKYKVKAADNMWSISQQKGVKLGRFLFRNHLNRGEEPATGEWVYLKGKAEGKPKMREKITAPTPDMMVKNTVKPDNTATTNTAEIKWEDPKKLNEQPVKPQSMKDSMVLFDLEDATASTDTGVKAKDLPMIEMNPIVAPSTTTAVKHTVIKGDTMYNISKRYGVTIDDIRKWNNMPDNNVKLGQVLLINP